MKCFIYVQHEYNGKYFIAYKKFHSFANRDWWIKHNKQFTREFSQESGVFFGLTEDIIPGIMVRYGPLWSKDHSPTRSLNRINKMFEALEASYGFVTNRNEVHHDYSSLSRRLDID